MIDNYNVLFKDKQVKIIAVGVGTKVLESELLQIALNIPENVFMVNDYGNLVENMDKILKSSCVSGTKKPYIYYTKAPKVTDVV